MIWLDSVLATPLIGIRLVPNREKLHEFKEHALRIISGLYGKFDKIQTNRHKDDFWGYNVKAGNYSFDLLHNNIIVRYEYRHKTHNEAGNLPSLLQPELQSYSSLFDEIRMQIQKIFEVIEIIDGYAFDRIGLVAEVKLDEESLPPGLQEFLHHLGKPWNNNISAFGGVISAELDRSANEGYSDSCHHTVKFEKDKLETSGYTLMLDWQRLYEEPIPIKLKNLLEDIENCSSKAFHYFETFGEGDLNYE